MPPKAKPLATHFVGTSTVDGQEKFAIFLTNQVVSGPKPKVGADVRVQGPIGLPTGVHISLMGSADLCKSWITVKEKGQYSFTFSSTSFDLSRFSRPFKGEAYDSQSGKNGRNKEIRAIEETSRSGTERSVLNLNRLL